MTVWRALIIAIAGTVSAWGAWAWWRYRQMVVHLLRAILDELRRRPPRDEDGPAAP